jgi:hypothetical protein
MRGLGDCSCSFACLPFRALTTAPASRLRNAVHPFGARKKKDSLLFGCSESFVYLLWELVSVYAPMKVGWPVWPTTPTLVNNKDRRDSVGAVAEAGVASSRIVWIFEELGVDFGKARRRVKQT